MLPNGIVGTYDINSFKKSPALNKEYIFNRMKGNPIYGMFVPDEVDPKNLSRNFLLSVSHAFYIFIVNCSFG